MYWFMASTIALRATTSSVYQLSLFMCRAGCRSSAVARRLLFTALLLVSWVIVVAAGPSDPSPLPLTDDEDAFPRSAFQPSDSDAPVPSIPPDPLSSAPSLDHDELAFHRNELAQLEVEQKELRARIREAQLQQELLDLRIVNEQHFYEETHANAVVRNTMPSPRGAMVRQLECEGWKKTSRCSARGERRPAMDRSCLAEIRGGAAGYCEVRDATTGEFFKAMRVDCGTVRTSATFWCELAPQFANFPAEIERVVVAQHQEEATRTPLPSPNTAPSKGIAVFALASQFQQLEQTIRSLRALGCKLPIEIWYFETDMDSYTRTNGSPWKTNDPDAKLRPLSTLPYTSTTIKYAKIHAIVHSAFQQVLCLDIDVVLLRDPTYLFSLPEFRETGVIFWPDVVHSSSPEAHVVASSLLWELLDMPFVRMFEQDDHQLLVNRDVKAVRVALQVLALFASQRPNLFTKLELVERVKDYARLAWLKTRAPFHMVEVPPVLGGMMLADGRFCGSHIIQHDPSGEQVFLHHLVDASDHDSRSVAPTEQYAAAQLTHQQVFNWRDGTSTAKRLSDADMMFYYDVRSFETGDGDHKRRCRAHMSTHPQADRVKTITWAKPPGVSFPVGLTIARS